MMYYFSDFDDEKREDITIKDKAYIQLIDVCFRYCAKFSFTFRSHLSEIATMMLNPLPYRNDNGLKGYPKCYYYTCTASTKDFLLSERDDLFGWIDSSEKHGPEDLTFYREDGSVFFWSETHEGICALFNQEGEDIAMLIAQKGWRYFDPINGKAHFLIPKNLYST